MVSTKDLYDELLLTIVKSVGNSPKRGYIRNVNRIHDATELKVIATLKKILKRARKRFLSQFKVTNLSLKVTKADDANSIEAELRQMMASAFDGASPELTAALESHIADISQNFSSVYNVDVNYSLVNDNAVNYLRENNDKYFSDFTANAAKGIDNSIADAMSVPLTYNEDGTTEGGYSIPSIVNNIRDTWGKDTIEFPSQTLDVDTWATLTARTETARASSYSTQATLESLGMTKWQWYCNDDPCDICGPNNEQIVNVGDAFNSSDTEPPSHPNCRCITIALQEELGSSSDTTENQPDDKPKEEKQKPPEEQQPPEASAPAAEPINPLIPDLVGGAAALAETAIGMAALPEVAPVAVAAAVLPEVLPEIIPEVLPEATETLASVAEIPEELPSSSTQMAADIPTATRVSTRLPKPVITDSNDLKTYIDSVLSALPNVPDAETKSYIASVLAHLDSIPQSASVSQSAVEAAINLVRSAA